MYALVDCNSFYASCEQVFRPDLRDKPVVVLSNNDGCIVAKSKEARMLNIPGFAPYFKYKEVLHECGVSVFSSNYELYGDTSRRVMQVLERFADCDIYSIDEAFLDFSNIKVNHRTVAQSIRDAVMQEVRIPVSVGIAPTKTLAKLANHIAKKAPHLHSLCLLQQSSTIDKALEKVAVADVWGVGPRLAKKLSYLDIHTAKDLAVSNQKYMRQLFSVTLERTIKELNAESCLQVEDVTNKKNIMCSRMFSHPVTECVELERAASSYAARACEKLRKQQGLVKTVYIKIMTSRFESRPFKESTVLTLVAATDDSREIIKLARQGVRRMFKEGYRYNKVAIGLLSVEPSQFYQPCLFQPRPKEQKLMALLDELNHKQSASVYFASQGVDASWQMARKRKSPSYTTCWEDIPTVYV